MNNQNNMNKNVKSTFNRLMVGFIITLAVFVVGGMIYIYIRSPKTSELGSSKYFTTADVYAKSEEVIELFENRDYAELRDNYCNEEMAAKMTDEALTEAVDSLGDNWGSRTEIKSKEGFEVNQSGEIYAMTRYKLTYENIELDYTIMFDTDMKLAGFSMEPQD